jgi:hypothetical protein
MQRAVPTLVAMPDRAGGPGAAGAAAITDPRRRMTMADTSLKPYDEKAFKMGDYFAARILRISLERFRSMLLEWPVSRYWTPRSQRVGVQTLRLFYEKLNPELRERCVQLELNLDT